MPHATRPKAIGLQSGLAFSCGIVLLAFLTLKVLNDFFYVKLRHPGFLTVGVLISLFAGVVSCLVGVIFPRKQESIQESKANFSLLVSVLSMSLGLLSVLAMIRFFGSGSELIEIVNVVKSNPGGEISPFEEVVCFSNRTREPTIILGCPISAYQIGIHVDSLLAIESSDWMA